MWALGRGSAKVIVPLGRVKCSSSTAVYSAETGGEGRKGEGKREERKVEREGKVEERQGGEGSGREEGEGTPGGQLKKVNFG